MEAVPRLPMISFDIKVNTEIVSFGSKVKQYISNFYHEDPESYNNEIHSLETLRAAAVRPSIDVSGCQMLKKYYCQLHFLKSRFPMEENQACAVYFSWRDNYSNMVCSVPDIDFELMNILYDIGAVHSKLGAADSRVTAEGMKMACTHFQCAAWAFQTVRETFPQMVSLVLAPEVIHFMHLTCLAQAQECILEKSMMDNRKAAIIAKVAVQVVDYYKQALATLQASGEEGSLSDLLGSRTYKDWVKYLNFKVSYHKSIALLYQGQQAEEQQKMGERVAFYQAASDQLQEACKRANNLSHQQEIGEALAFTGDVVEGKRKAAKNENEFIYHEDVPDKDALQEVKGASLVKGIAFNINDVEVSGADIFARLVPMEAHEASSMYSEQKAQMLRQLGEVVENKDRALAEFMSSMQLDVLSQMRQANGLTQDLVDRAAAMSARPTATQDLVSAMAKLSNTYHDVESMLNEIDCLLKEEEKNEQDYQSQMGSRPPGIIATDLTREFTKYQEAHSKASDSNQNLHRAMTTHIANLKVLANPLSQLQKLIPAVEFPHPQIDEDIIREMETLLGKVEEMKNQRGLLWGQLRDAMQSDDITGLLITRPTEKSLEQLFQQELQKHQRQAALIEQNMAAQENILKALIDTYARFTPTRRYLQDIIGKRSSTLTALVHSYDTYDDLLAKANKGLEFYNKLETNVTKLLQRIKSTCKVQDEEREQMLSKHNKKTIVIPKSGPKLKDYLDQPKLKDYIDAKKVDNVSVSTSDTINPSAYSTGMSGMVSNLPDQVWPPAVRPAPVGSETNSDTLPSYTGEQGPYTMYTLPANSEQLYYNPAYATTATTLPNTTTTHSTNYMYMQQPASDKAVEHDLSNRMAALMSNRQVSVENQEIPQQFIAPTQAYGYLANSSNPQVMPNQNMYYQPTEQFPKHETTGAMYSNNFNSGGTSAAGPQTPVVYPGSSYTYPPNNYTYDTPTTQVSNNFAYASMPQNYNAGTPYSAAVQPSDAYIQPVQTSNVYGPVNTVSYGHSYDVPNSYVQANSNSYTNSVQANSNYPNSSSYAQAIQGSQNYSQINTQISDPTNQNKPYNLYSNSGLVNPDNSNVYSNPEMYAGNYNMYQQYAEQGGASVAADPYNSKQVYGPTYNPDVAPNMYYSYNNQPVDGVANYGSYTTAGVSQPLTNTTSAGYAACITSYQSSSVNSTVNTLNTIVDQPKTEKSNVDLLSGLDFSINQVPLMPQQNKVENPVKDVSATKTVEQPIVNSVKPSSIRSEEKISVLRDTPSTEKKVCEKYFQKDAFEDPVLVKQFVQEVDKFEKLLDLLITKTLNGPTPLDLKWKEIQDKQEIEQQRKSISVARCYPMKNRFPDILPYDQTRVKLTTTKDDYINASYIKDISPNSPLFIVTQSPIQSTFNEFWTMVWEQQIETISCLLGDAEMEQDIYWPKECDHPLYVGNMTISLQSSNVKEHWTERIICIYQQEQRISRTVRHLQFTTWPGSLFPTSAAVVSYINEILKDQTVLMEPLLVHCLAGIGRSGLLCLLIAAITETLINPTIMPDLASIVVKLSNTRKNILRDREHFKFAYHAFLHFLKEICVNRIQEKQPDDASLIQPQPSTNTLASNSAHDPLNMLDPLWATKKNM